MESHDWRAIAEDRRREVQRLRQLIQLIQTDAKYDLLDEMTKRAIRSALMARREMAWEKTLGGR